MYNINTIVYRRANQSMIVHLFIQVVCAWLKSHIKILSQVNDIKR